MVTLRWIYIEGLSGQNIHISKRSRKLMSLHVKTEDDQLIKDQND